MKVPSIQEAVNHLFLGFYAYFGFRLAAFALDVLLSNLPKG